MTVDEALSHLDAADLAILILIHERVRMDFGPPECWGLVELHLVSPVGHARYELTPLGVEVAKGARQLIDAEHAVEEGAFKFPLIEDLTSRIAREIGEQQDRNLLQLIQSCVLGKLE